MSQLRVLDVAIEATTCDVVCDGVVPLRIRTYRDPIGAAIIRLGDGRRQLLELLVNPHTGTLRGATLVAAVTSDRPPPIIVPKDQQEGLPVLAVKLQPAQIVDSGLAFSVGFDASTATLWWGEAGCCDLLTCGRVDFLVKDEAFVGFRCRLDAEEIANVFAAL